MSEYKMYSLNYFIVRIIVWHLSNLAINVNFPHFIFILNIFRRD